MLFKDPGFLNCHTYHIDVRFEMAFTQIYEIVSAVKKAVEAGRRVIVEHFEIIYPMLTFNAELLIGIGEEVIVTRPNIFGPKPKDIADIVFSSIKYRKMAHTAEDLVSKVLREEMGILQHFKHSDVRHGFIMGTDKKPDINIQRLESRVKDYIVRGIDVHYLDESHILLDGHESMRCTGPRIHVGNTSEIVNFQLLKEIQYDNISKTYALVGLVGCENAIDITDLNRLML